MELYFAAYKSEKVTGNFAKVRAIENSFDFISTGKECAEIFGMLKASLEKSGTLLETLI